MATPTEFVSTSTTPLPDSITSPPTVQFTPAPGCLDAANNWIVTTSCYLDLASEIQYPDWLTCTVNVFGAPSWNDPSCSVPYPARTTADGAVGYYSGCPEGHSTVNVYTNPGYYTWEYSDTHFDATAYGVQCCPTQYNFGLDYPAGDNPRQKTSTRHDGVDYSLFVYPLPGCVATSVSQLSGKDVPVQTTLNDMAWDKRQAQTIKWNYETDSIFANLQELSYTVFQGTHTCFEDCDQWFTYYYPRGEGGTPGPWPTSSDEGTTPLPEPTPTPEPTSAPESTQEPEPTPTPQPSSVPDSTSDVSPSESASDIASSVPGSVTTTAVEGNTAVPSGTDAGGRDSSTIPSDATTSSTGDSTSTEPPVPSSEAGSVTHSSLVAVVMLSIYGVILC
ncbi:hypothetical protein F4808DRAFT_411096 [Astrocystis sublimbata]|nr:hypothetical protein F4808DRAFT_411096 [Astrocystis sublimbata]